MRTLGMASVAVGSFALAALFSGCFCSMWEDPWNCRCETDWDCEVGYYCDCVAGDCTHDGQCVPGDTCGDDGSCEPGFVCDIDTWTCLPQDEPDLCRDELCPIGYYMDPATGDCIGTAECFFDGDPICFSEEVCDTVHRTCVPADRDCINGGLDACELLDRTCDDGEYFDTDLGMCVLGWYCSGAGDPKCVNEGYDYCDPVQHSCIPFGRSCEDQPIPCEDNAGCPLGQECVDGACVVPPPPPEPNVCTFNFECGPNGICINGECHAGCASDADCPTGQTCDASICFDDPTPEPECQYSEDCGAGFYCINATCYTGCTTDADCGPNEFCKVDVCRADYRPQPECQFNTDCTEGEECFDAVCRVRCWADTDCAALGTGAYCFVEHCIFPEEANAQCGPDVSCPDAADCVNGMCGG